MKLSTKSTYGLRAMLAIARAGGKTVSVAEIADTEGISVDYLEQLLNRLRRAGLIASVRGPNGGYRLARGRARITVGDIVKVLEGGVYPVHCVRPADRGGYACKNAAGCVPKTVWARLASAIDDCLGSITLDALCAETGAKTR